MILEQAILDVKPQETKQFEAAFARAQRIIAASPGYLSHELQRCIEREGQYLLLVRWESVEAHEVGFRKCRNTRSGKSSCTTSGRASVAMS